MELGELSAPPSLEGDGLRRIPVSGGQVYCKVKTLGGGFGDEDRQNG